MSLTNQELNPEESSIEQAANNLETSENDCLPTNSATTSDIPDFGWSAYAERMNGRFAMIGFTAVLIIEAITNQTFLNWSGLIN